MSASTPLRPVWLALAAMSLACTTLPAEEAGPDAGGAGPAPVQAPFTGAPGGDPRAAPRAGGPADPEPGTPPPASPIGPEDEGPDPEQPPAGGEENPDPRCTGQELSCLDGQDEDCDGLADCADPDCAQEPGCQCQAQEAGAACGDGLDNDCDDLADCDDPDCAAAEACACGEPETFNSPGLCSDGYDNDCDDLVDCEDPDCDGSWRVPEGNCEDGIDNNCDGLADCDDPTCAASEVCTPDCECHPGTQRWCDTPIACLWGTQQCQPDGSWGPCLETQDRPFGCQGQDIYGLLCCIAAGQCCQNFPFNQNAPSIGNCDGIACE